MKFQLTIRGVNYNYIYSSIPKGWRLEEPKTNRRFYSLVFDFEAENPEAAQVRLIEEIGKAQFGRNNRKAFYLPLLKPQNETPTQRHQREEYESALKHEKVAPATGELIWFSDPQPIDIKLLMDQHDSAEIERQRADRRSKFEKLAATVKELSEKSPAELDQALENVEALLEVKLPEKPTEKQALVQPDEPDEAGWFWVESDASPANSSAKFAEQVEVLHQVYLEQKRLPPQSYVMIEGPSFGPPIAWSLDRLPVGSALPIPPPMLTQTPLHSKVSQLFSDDENWLYFARTLPENNHLFGYFLPCVDNAKLASLMAADDRIFRFVVENEIHFPGFRRVCDEILKAGMQQRLVKKIRRSRQSTQQLSNYLEVIGDSIRPRKRGW